MWSWLRLSTDAPTPPVPPWPASSPVMQTGSEQERHATGQAVAQVAHPQRAHATLSLASLTQLLHAALPEARLRVTSGRACRPRDGTTAVLLLLPLAWLLLLRISSSNPYRSAWPGVSRSRPHGLRRCRAPSWPLYVPQHASLCLTPAPPFALPLLLRRLPTSHPRAPSLLLAATRQSPAAK